MSSAVQSEFIPTLPKRRRGPPPSLKLPTSSVAVPTHSRPALIQVTPSLYISGYDSAKNYAALSTVGITHILNLVGEHKCPNIFLDKFTYSSLMLPDNPRVDILFFLYFAFEFISSAIGQGGKVLVHCMRGTSRAPTIACAYIMHMENISEVEAFRRIKALHPGADPNLGFVCQLRNFDSQEEERKVYSYSEKYDMFTNKVVEDGVCMMVEDGEMTLVTSDEAGERERHIGLLCMSLWERFKGRLAYRIHIQ